MKEERDMDIGEAMAEGLQMRLRAWDAYYANPSKETWARYEAVVEESWALAGEFVQTALAGQSWRRLPEAEAVSAVVKDVVRVPLRKELSRAEWLASCGDSAQRLRTAAEAARVSGEPLKTSEFLETLAGFYEKEQQQGEQPCAEDASDDVAHRSHTLRPQ